MRYYKDKEGNQVLAKQFNNGIWMNDGYFTYPMVVIQQGIPGLITKDNTFQPIDNSYFIIENGEGIYSIMELEKFHDKYTPVN